MLHKVSSLHGFPIGFLKKMWPKVKVMVKELLDDMCGGPLNLERMNYVIITLLPKIKDANTIKHYRPICLLNVFF